MIPLPSTAAGCPQMANTRKIKLEGLRLVYDFLLTVLEAQGKAHQGENQTDSSNELHIDFDVEYFLSQQLPWKD